MKIVTHHIFFNNLANPLRIRIIYQLKDKNMCVKELSSNLKVEQSKLSHALSSLKECNIVLSKQEGKNRIYMLNKKTIVPLFNIIENHSLCEYESRCKGCDKCKLEKNENNILR